MSHLFPKTPFHFLVLLFKMSLAPWQCEHFPYVFLKSFMFCFFFFLSPISPSHNSQDATVSRSSCFLATQFDADFAGLVSSSFASFDFLLQLGKNYSTSCMNIYMPHHQLHNLPVLWPSLLDTERGPWWLLLTNREMNWTVSLLDDLRTSCALHLDECLTLDLGEE